MSDSRDAPVSYAFIDLAAVVISPTLVMIMVASLVYFAVDTIYSGAHPYRLYWCLGFFVFGAVLIARLSIETSRKYAALYAAGLGGACYLAMMQYVSYPPGILSSVGPILNILLMALIWFMADKLTWDCTHLVEDQKASGRGILAATGLESTGSPEELEPEEPPADAKRRRKQRKWEEGFVGWIERYKAYRKDQKKKPHTPGTWVLYFGLGALPFFALGQSLVPADDAARRTAILIDAALYVGSGLGLLVTTTLFGLRKYLMQRNARVPPVLAASWLGLGAGLIILFLCIAAILPRPHSETPLVDLGGRKKTDRSASRYAVVRDKDAGKGKGAAGQKAEKGQGKASAKGGESGGSSGEKGSGGGKGDSSGGEQKGEGKSGNDKSGKQSEQTQGKQTKGQKSQSKVGEKESQSKEDQEQKGEENQSGGETEHDSQDDVASDGSDSSTSSFSKLTQVLDGLSDVVKWIVWIVLAIAVVVGIVVFFLKYLAPFTKWAKGLLDWLRGLFGSKAGAATVETAAAAEKVERPPPTFAEFENPFVDGSAGRRNLAELAAYTFAALDAWAWDRNRGRKPEETPMEFATRVGHAYPALDEPAYRAADLLVRVMYSGKPLPPDARKTLAELWQQMDSTQARRSSDSR